MHIKKTAVFILCLFILNGCGASQDNEALQPDVTVKETGAAENIFGESDNKSSAERSVAEDLVVDDEDPGDSVIAEDDPEELLEAFLAGDIPAIYDDESGSVIMYDQLPHDEDDWECYSVGERVDLDNDGENEQIVHGPYGGIYFDVRDGKVYVLAAGKGMAGVLSYTDYDNAIWIVHRDTSHMGRQIYWLTRYDGGGNIVDEFKLGAEYWDSTDDKYHENSDFTYRDEKISMKEYEELIREIF